MGKMGIIRLKAAYTLLSAQQKSRNLTMKFQLFYLNGRFIYRAHAHFGCANVVCGSTIVAVVRVSKLGKSHDAVLIFAIHALRVLSSS